MKKLNAPPLKANHKPLRNNHLQKTHPTPRGGATAAARPPLPPVGGGAPKNPHKRLLNNHLRYFRRLCEKKHKFLPPGVDTLGGAK
jgi:hypothetical protein